MKRLSIFSACGPRGYKEFCPLFSAEQAARSSDNAPRTAAAPAHRLERDERRLILVFRSGVR